MNVRRHCFLIVVMALASSPVYADTIRLKSGGAYTGRIVSQDPSTVTIEVEGKKTTIAKSDIAALRYDENGMEYFRKQEAGRLEKEKENAEQLEKDLKKSENYFPNGFLIGGGYSIAKFQSASEGLGQRDRFVHNFLVPSDFATASLPRDTSRFAGYNAHAQYRRERWYVDLSGFSITGHSEYHNVGLPAITSILSQSAVRVNSLSKIDMTQVKAQRGNGSFGFEPILFSSVLRIYFFAGVSGLLEAAPLRGASLYTFTNPTPLIVLYYTNYIDFKTKTGGSGPRGGVDLRYRTEKGFEIQLLGARSSFVVPTKIRGKVFTGPNNASVSPTPSLQFLDSKLVIHSIDYTLGAYYPIASRFRIFAGVSGEQSRVKQRNTVTLISPDDVNLATFWNTNSREFFIRYWDRPTARGRITMFFAGVETRL